MNAFFLRLLLSAVLLVPGTRCFLSVQSGPVPARLWRTGDVVHFATAAAAVEIDVASFALRLTDADGDVRAEQVARGFGYERGGTPFTLGAVRDFDLRAGALVLAAESDEPGVLLGHVALRWTRERTLEVAFDAPEQDPRFDRVSLPVAQFRDAWALREGESIYGLSSRVGSQTTASPDFPPPADVFPTEVGGLDRRGEVVELFVQPTIALYTPFYVSSSGYGLYVDRTTVGRFDVGAAAPDVLAVAFEAGSSAEHAAYRFYVFAGDAAQTLDEYTAQTGRPFRPPDWFFRHWRWRDELRIGAPGVLDGIEVNADLATDLEQYDFLGIPAGVYLIDRPWSEGSFGFDNFRWNETRLPNVAAMLDRLTARGWKLVVWSAAWAIGRNPGDNGSEAAAAGYLAPRSDRILDLTNPEARAWWTAKHVDFATRWNIAGIKLDRGEEFIPSLATDVWADGRSGRELRNAYPRLQLQVYHDAMRQARGDDFVVIARSSWAGAQRFGAFWGGDLPGSEFFGGGPGTDLGLRAAIIGLQRAAFMGIPFWGSDAGGYYEFKDRDVFARWIEFSAFCALMEIGGTGAHAPWAMPTDPTFDIELMEIYRRYVQLHHDLIPYMLAHVDEAVTRGVPLARPLVLAYPEDPNVRDLWDEFLFGRDLLVAPVWQIDTREREVYLPAGLWEDFWDASRVYQGPTTIRAPAPLDRIPVFVRAGAVVQGRP